MEEQAEIIYKLQRCSLNTQLEIAGKTYLLAHGSPIELFNPATSKYDHPVMHHACKRCHSHIPGHPALFG